MDKIKNKLSLVPNLPGCYLMKNIDNTIIYVGKAKKLKNRLSSYFRGNHTGKTAKLVSEIDSFDYIIVNSEVESLILELNLIKENKPKYNILLTDDKTYPYIKLTYKPYPKLSIVRNLTRKTDKNSKLFGPYPNVYAAKESVNLLNRIYPLRKCTTFNKRPCLYYHINQCLGYCTHNVKMDDEQLKEITKFLKGDIKDTISLLKDQMYNYSKNLNFEKANEIKKMIDFINVTLTKQSVELTDLVDKDVVGYYNENDYLSIQIFFIRNAKIASTYSKIIPIIEDIETELTRFITSLYNKQLLVPKEIIIPSILNDNILNNILNTKIIKPLKGTKKTLVEMANKNAKNNLSEKIQLIKKDEQKTILSNDLLKNILNLNKLDRIDLFDNSNLFGTYNVSGMVVFKNGKPSKNEYRKYKISIDKNDDYNTMKEVLYRRYFRVIKDNLEKPDLIIVDGGINQMNAAKDIIDSLNLNIFIAGLKKDNKHTTNSLLIYEKDIIKEIKIDKRSDLFYYLERMQDEVHNFTISYHKQIRSKGSLESILQIVPGIGPKRRVELLKKYRSINKLKQCSVEELSTILPENVATNLYDFLKKE